MRFNRWYWVSVLTPFLLAMAWMFLWPSALAGVRNLVFDSYQRASPRVWDQRAPVRIVDIDDVSLARYGKWPWPRTRIAAIVKRLAGAGAAVVAFDIVFSEPDRSSSENILAMLDASPTRDLLAKELASRATNDETLAQALEGQPVVLGSIATARAGTKPFPQKFGLANSGDDPAPFLNTFPGVLLPLKILADAAPGIALLNWVPDQDQVVRSVPLMSRIGDVYAPSLVAEALRVAQAASTVIVRASNASGEGGFGAKTGINTIKIGDIAIPTGAAGDVRVRFTPHEPRRFIPAWQVIEGDKLDVEGAIVFVGTSAAGLLDQRATPLDASVPGVEVHAQLAEHILDGGSLTRPDWAPGAEIAVAVLVCVLFMLLLPRVPPLALAFIGAAATASLVLGSWRLFLHAGILLDPVVPSLSAAFVYLSGVFGLYWTEQSQKQVVRKAFERFVAPAVVERLAAHPDRLVLGGENRVLTVLFTDLRNFTRLSEGLDARHLTRFMNEYLTPMTDLILDHGGTVDKYMGDAIMAFWNAPLDDPNHARNAARTVLAMIAKLDELNAMWQRGALAEDRNFPVVQAGLGINTGECCVGNLGSTRRFDYSCIGDEVNVASRLESATKYYGIDFLASETSRDLSADLAWLEIDKIVLKGKEKATRVFTIAGDEKHARSEEFIALASAHAAVLDAYRARRFGQVEALAEAARARAPRRVKGLYVVYAQRAQALSTMPPPWDWDGSTAMSDK